MTHRRWFLPDTPDVVGLLGAQTRIAVDALTTLKQWADGKAGADGAIAVADTRMDAARRELLEALRAAFVLPLEPEDAFALSRGLDRIVHHVDDLVKEARVLRLSPPDSGLAAMATRLAEAVGDIDRAIAQLTKDSDAATRSAEAAIEAERRLQDEYYAGMGSLLDVTDMRERIARRELYRRGSRIGEVVVDVAERVIYAVVKQS